MSAQLPFSILLGSSDLMHAPNSAILVLLVGGTCAFHVQHGASVMEKWHAQVGENRIVSLDSEPEDDSSAAPALIVQGDGTFRHERMWRGSAIAMPVFALRSRDSVGAGEFQDLKKLVTLCHQAGALSYKSHTASACAASHMQLTEAGCLQASEFSRERSKDEA